MRRSVRWMERRRRSRFEGICDGGGRQRLQKFKISDLRFEIAETATANIKAKTNADPSPLKGIRYDSGAACFP
jgi:hypothetical protein